MESFDQLAKPLFTLLVLPSSMPFSKRNQLTLLAFLQDFVKILNAKLTQDGNINIDLESETMINLLHGIGSCISSLTSLGMATFLLLI